ncbi:MAG: hypothetical protein H0V09_04735, partial [Gemmatimonadetes bacterium]|nr:hypothetical protein [Gemmatimonadota bacterium]
MKPADPQLLLFPGSPSCPAGQVAAEPGEAGDRLGEPRGGRRHRSPFGLEIPRRIPRQGVERTAVVEGQAVPCRIRRSSRARCFRLLVDRTGELTIVLPLRWPLADV